jgi:hypothetical protein
VRLLYGAAANVKKEATKLNDKALNQWLFS